MIELILWVLGIIAVVLKFKAISVIATWHWLVVCSPLILAAVTRLVKMGGSGVGEAIGDIIGSLLD